MRKLTLNIDALAVQSFETAATRKEQGTVLGHAPTNGHNTQCASAVDACPTRFCATNACEDTSLCTAENCGPTYDAVECPSIVDACPTRLCA